MNNHKTLESYIKTRWGDFYPEDIDGILQAIEEDKEDGQSSGMKIITMNISIEQNRNPTGCGGGSGPSDAVGGSGGN